jgi:hypothetical protein
MYYCLAGRKADGLSQCPTSGIQKTRANLTEDED